MKGRKMKKMHVNHNSKLDDSGKMVISLDFEMLWGVHDLITLDEYMEHIYNVEKVIPKMLNLFQKYDIHATWAVVGFLFYDSMTELINNIPEKKPNYDDQSLSSYSYMMKIVNNKDIQRYCFAKPLIKKIMSYDGQEIGSHTYSHYYCMDSGQSVSEFEVDLKMAIKVSKENGVNIKSFVFPKNQYKKEYLEILRENGVIAFRGNEKSKIYKPARSHENIVKRIFRLADSFMNITGSNCCSFDDIVENKMVNIHASRFLRPYMGKGKIIERIKLHRIKGQMTYAAKNRKIFHLWWHPHNFGCQMQENFNNLIEILNHYKVLKTKYNFQSFNMNELAKVVLFNENSITDNGMHR